MRKTGAVLHHSATIDGRTFDTAAIRRYHVEHNDWSNIGYHWIIEVVDGVPVITMGRYPDEDGAHCKDWGANKTHFGVCVVGNFDSTKPNEAVWKATVKFLKWLCREHGIKPMDVLGHWEVQKFADVPEEKRKTCPGRMFDMEDLRAELATI